MKIQSLILGDDTFTQEDFGKRSFERKISEKLGQILAQNDADSEIIRRGIDALKKIGENSVLTPNEVFAIQCFKIRAQISLIVDEETQASFNDSLQDIGPEDMVDMITLCTSEKDIQEMLTNIKAEQQKRSDFKDACLIFQEINFQNIGKQDCELICSLLREFDFNGELISLLENHPHRKIKVLENKTYTEKQNIVIQIDGESDTPSYYLEGQIFLKMKEIPVDEENKGNKQYYKGITFGGKSGILVVSDDAVYNQALDVTHSINGNPVILLTDIYGGGYHVYLPEENKIMHLHAVVVGMYYVDKNQRKIDEDDEDFDEQITHPEVKKVMRLKIDAERGLYFDFDGEDFGKLKIQTDDFILGRDANKTLH